MMPSSLAKMNRAGPAAAPLCTTNPVPPLKTSPVTKACAPDGVVNVTTSALGAPVPSWSVEVPVWLFAIHQGEVGLWTNPHALTRCESTKSATPG